MNKFLQNKIDNKLGTLLGLEAYRYERYTQFKYVCIKSNWGQNSHPNVLSHHMHICMWIKCKKTKQNLAEQDNKLGTLLEFETLGMNDISNLNMF